MFQFPTFALRLDGVAGLQPAGLPHSEIPESRVICTYSGLIAACHVLRRLREPRHPPSALLLLFAFSVLEQQDGRRATLNGQRARLTLNR